MQSLKCCVFTSLALLAGHALAASQPVYRCGDSYSQTPCANGQVVQTDDARDDAQRAAAKEGLSRDKALAKDMEATRRKDAAQALALDKAALARAEAAHKKVPADKKPATPAPKKKASGKREAKVKEQEDGVFTAHAPNQTPGEVPKKKTKKAAAAKP